MQHMWELWMSRRPTSILTKKHLVAVTLVEDSYYQSWSSTGSQHNQNTSDQHGHNEPREQRNWTGRIKYSEKCKTITYLFQTGNIYVFICSYYVLLHDWKYGSMHICVTTWHKRPFSHLRVGLVIWIKALTSVKALTTNRWVKRIEHALMRSRAYRKPLLFTHSCTDVHTHIHNKWSKQSWFIFPYPQRTLRPLWAGCEIQQALFKQDGDKPAYACEPGAR